MPRPVKVGLEYFSLDCHIDGKIKLIQRDFGLKGFAIVVMLYQYIYSERGYYCEWNDETLLGFSQEYCWDFDNDNLIKEVVKSCIIRGIFSQDLFEKYHILTSRGVQKRYFAAVSRREKVEVKKEYLLVDVPKNASYVHRNIVNDNSNSKNVNRSTQSKESKESKEKDAASAQDCVDEEDDFFIDESEWVQY